MAKQTYFEGWGYSDTIKLLLKGKTPDRDLFYRELKATFPKDDIQKVGNDTIEAFVYEKQIPAVKKMARIFKMKIAYEGGGSTNDYTVQKIILEQLGGQGKLRVMTGAHNFVAKPNGLWFKIKNRRINYVEVVLNGKDLYDMKFGKMILGKQLKVIAEHKDLYFDQLIPVFEKETGMYLKLFKKGGFVSTQNRDMVLSQLKSIHHHEQELLNAIKTSPEIEAWVLAKVQRATTDLSDVAHYVMGKSSYKIGGSVSETNKWTVQVRYKTKSNERSKIWETTVSANSENEAKQEAKKMLKNIHPDAKILAKDVKVFDYIADDLPDLPIPPFPSGSATKKYWYKGGGEVYVPEISFKRLQNEFKSNTEIFNGEVVTRGQNQFKIEKGFLYVKRPNGNWEKFSVIKYAEGGMVDLFEDYDNIPQKIQVILDKYADDFEEGNYEGLAKALKEVEKNGYTFDYYLDGVAYGLRPKNVKITDLKGYEQFATGGVPQGLSVADANPYIAGAKAVQGIAPESVSAIDKKLASRINPDPNRPVFF